MRFILITLSIIAFSSCNKGEIKELKDINAGMKLKIESLEAKIEFHKNEKNELKVNLELTKSKLDIMKKTSQGLFVEGNEQYLKGIAEQDVKKSINHLDSAGKTLINLTLRYPKSSEALQAEILIKKINDKNKTNHLIQEFNDVVTKDSEKSRTVLSNLKKLISKEEYSKKLALIEKREKVEYEEKNKPISVTHTELHKLKETGMTVNKKHEVYARFHRTGDYLLNPHGGERQLSSTWITISQNFSKYKSGKLYDLRSKEGCFRLHMNYQGRIVLDDFRRGKCDHANWTN